MALLNINCHFLQNLHQNLKINGFSLINPWVRISKGKLSNHYLKLLKNLLTTLLLNNALLCQKHFQINFKIFQCEISLLLHHNNKDNNQYKIILKIKYINLRIKIEFWGMPKLHNLDQDLWVKNLLKDWNHQKDYNHLLTKKKYNKKIFKLQIKMTIMLIKIILKIFLFKIIKT